MSSTTPEQDLSTPTQTAAPSPTPSPNRLLNAAPFTLSQSVAEITPIADDQTFVVTSQNQETEVLNAVVSKSSWEAMVQACKSSTNRSFELELIIRETTDHLFNIKMEEINPNSDIKPDIKPNIKPIVKPESPDPHLSRSPAPSPEPSLPPSLPSTSSPDSTQQTRSKISKRKRKSYSVDQGSRTERTASRSAASTSTTLPPTRLGFSRTALLQHAHKVPSSVELVYYYKYYPLFKIQAEVSTLITTLRKAAVERLGWPDEDDFVFSVEGKDWDDFIILKEVISSFGLN